MALRYEIKASKYHSQVLAERDVALDMSDQCCRRRTPCNSERPSKYLLNVQKGSWGPEAPNMSSDGPLAEA